MKRPASLPPLIGPREAVRSHWIKVVEHVIMLRAGRGELWPAGTAEEVADLVAGLPQAEAVDLIEQQLLARDVGSRNTFAGGSGI